MKAVMMSIQPEWCEKIASGKKTIEVRKNRPKLEVPFKVYVYCTKPTHRFSVGCGNYYFDDQLFKENGKIVYGCDFGGIFEPTVYYNAKVIGEFVCDGTYQISAHKTDEFHGNGFINCSDFGPYFGNGHKVAKAACITGEQALEYLGNNMTRFAWHITDLVIYDKPKELSEFRILNKEKQKACAHRERYYTNPDWTNSAELPAGFTCDIGTEIDFCRPYKNKSCTCLKPITRPPQSWCYVEEMRADYEEFKKEKIKS